MILSCKELGSSARGRLKQSNIKIAIIVVFIQLMPCVLVCRAWQSLGDVQILLYEALTLQQMINRQRDNAWIEDPDTL